jgi:hypothetical protein
MPNDVDPSFKAHIVALILEREPDEALRRLSHTFQTTVPQLRLGPVRGYGRRALAVYVQRERAIYAVNREALYNPFVILHEFYHHLRTVAGEHRGTERHADQFARDFLVAYNAVHSRHKAPGLGTRRSVK